MPKETFFNLPDEKRESILDVAINEFAENDYQNVSISRLVEKAGIAKGSFYQYFDGKEDLYRHLLEQAGREKQEFLSQSLPGPGVDIFDYLRWLVREGVRFEFAHPRLAQVGYRAVTGAGYPPAFIEKMKAQGLAFFRQLVTQGKAQGAIAPDVDEDLAAFFFNTIFTELGQYIIRRFPHHPARQSAEMDEVRTFFETDEVQELFKQTVMILERGMSRDRQDTENDDVNH